MNKAKQPILYALFALASVLVEYLVFFLLELIWGTRIDVTVYKIISRIISSFFNFNVNYRFVYDRDESYGKSLVKYYCLAIPVMFLSTALLKLVAVWTKIDQLTAGMNKTKSAVLHTLINAPVDLVIMIGNYLAQKYWVIVKKK